MPQNLLQPFRFTRLLACTATSAILVLGLCGCQTAGVVRHHGVAGRKGRNQPPAADPRREVELARDRFRANPKDADAALQYGKALRATGQKAQAVAVLEQATIAHPGNKALLAGYGRALADNGNFQQAFDVLSRAHTPDDPDWRILSAAGSRARPTRPIRRSAAVLCERAEDRARRTVGAVQSRPFLRPFERSAQGGGDLAPRQ